jgi:hypothetical protein
MRELRKTLNISDDVHKVRLGRRALPPPWRPRSPDQRPRRALASPLPALPPASHLPHPPHLTHLHLKSNQQRMMEDIKMDHSVSALQSGSVPSGMGGAAAYPPAAAGPPRLPSKPPPSERRAGVGTREAACQP